GSDMEVYDSRIEGIPTASYGVPTASYGVPTARRSSHCQKKRDAAAEKIALLLKSSSNRQSKSYDSYANSAIFSTGASLFFWQWELSSLVVGTFFIGSGNFFWQWELHN
nr:hypothetical protein [Tanacetum cinerariifolium]